MKIAVVQDVVHWEAAAAAGIKVNIAGGNLAAFLSKPEAFLQSIEIDKGLHGGGLRPAAGSGPRPWRRIHRGAIGHCNAPAHCVLLRRFADAQRGPLDRRHRLLWRLRTRRRNLRQGGPERSWFGHLKGQL
jgi:hypothetical protein